MGKTMSNETKTQFLAVAVLEGVFFLAAIVTNVLIQPFVVRFGEYHNTAALSWIVLFALVLAVFIGVIAIRARKCACRRPGSHQHAALRHSRVSDFGRSWRYVWGVSISSGREIPTDQIVRGPARSLRRFSFSTVVRLEHGMDLGIFCASSRLAGLDCRELRTLPSAQRRVAIRGRIGAARNWPAK